MSMFCYQCEQAAKRTGCSSIGICGKDPETAALQDLLVFAAEGIAMYAHRAAQLGARDPDADRFVIEALFSTVTNVNFDPERLESLLLKAAAMRDRARALYEKASKAAGRTPEAVTGAATWRPAGDRSGLQGQGEAVSILKRREAFGDDIAGLQDLLLFGLKGAAAYADHAMVLGKEDGKLCAAFHEHLVYLAEGKPTVDELLKRCLAAGELNLKVMALLDEANTGAYGDPVPTRVRVTPVKGKAILVSGHDLRDLDELLRQTAGKGISVYTHGEMLPAHGYPKLKAHKHLVGNYGGAWQDQAKEFEAFPGAILMTTNCIQRPRTSYKARIFTSGLVAWPGVVHIPDRNFAPVIEAALAAPGFTEETLARCACPDPVSPPGRDAGVPPATPTAGHGQDARATALEPVMFHDRGTGVPPVSAPAKKESVEEITVGFGHHAVMSVADKVIEAVKKGAIRRFFLIGGCDGAKPGRNYFTQFAEAVPGDCVILTLACGKYRFNKLDFGDIGGIPRLLDIGQCNDAYSAVQIAVALAKAFDCGVNDLPLSLILSWYEQKAVAVLLTLLHLGVRNIRLGPTLPAFVTPAVLKVLSDKFNIMPTESVEKDLEDCLAGA